MSAFYCMAFIEYMLKRKALLDYTNLFFPKIIYKYFKDKYGRRSKSAV